MSHCIETEATGTIRLPWGKLKDYVDKQKNLDITVSFDGRKPAVCYRTDGDWSYGDTFINAVEMQNSLREKGSHYWSLCCKPCPSCQRATVWPFVLAAAFSITLIAVVFFVGRKAGVHAGQRLAQLAMKNK